MNQWLRIVFGLLTACEVPASSGMPPAPPAPPPPPTGGSGSAHAPPVPSGIPDYIGHSHDAVALFAARDAAGLARVAHPRVRAAIAVQSLTDADWRVQAARGASSTYSPRTDGSRWLVAFRDLDGGDVAAIALERDGPMARFVEMVRLPRTEFDAFGSVP